MQDQKNTPWENEELKKLEEEMRRLEESDLATTAKTCKAVMGVGCDGLHTEVPLGLARETRGEVVDLLEKVEQCGRRGHRCSS